MGQCWILGLFNHAIYRTCESQFDAYKSAVTCHSYLSSSARGIDSRHPFDPLLAFCLPSFLAMDGRLRSFILVLSL
jgi:hypothetical protein